MHKLFVLDLDGTLLNRNKEISVADQEAVQTCLRLGVHVTLASGRAPSSVREYGQRLGLEFPLIAWNGAMIVDATTGYTIYEQPISLEIVKQVIHKCQQWATTIQWYHLDSNIYKVTVLERDDSRLREQMNYFKQWSELSVSRTGKSRFDILAAGVNKQTAVQYISEQYNIPREEIIAIGDYDNDIDLIRWVGTGIAMGNGNEQIKKYAQWVTTSNEEEGVANVVKRFWNM